MKTTSALLLFGALAFGQMNHDAMVRGDHVMGFSHEKTTHHFGLNQHRGIIEVRANDLGVSENDFS